jgi:FAD-dependent urate hydroxylase
MSREDPFPSAHETGQPVWRLLRRKPTLRAGATPDVAIIAAGPYGLAAVTFCRAAGAAIQIFGRPMESWLTAKPGDMILRSRWRSSHIASPADVFSLDRFERVIGRTLPDHIAIADFVEYGRWSQAEAVPELDQRLVRNVEQNDQRFKLTLDDGEATEADAVIVAAGLGRFPHRPQPFTGLPPDLVTHTADHHYLSVFRAKRVLVVGAGQSALESAALLHESGTQVEVLARAQALEFLAPEEVSGFVRRANAAIAPPTDVGGG